MQNKFWFVSDGVGVINMEFVKRIYCEENTLCIEWIESGSNVVSKYTLDSAGEKSWDDALAFVKFIEKRDQRHRMAEEAAHNL